MSEEEKFPQTPSKEEGNETFAARKHVKKKLIDKICEEENELSRCSNCGKETGRYVVLSPTTNEKHRHMCKECAEEIMLKESLGREADCPLCEGKGKITFIKLKDFFEQIEDTDKRKIEPLIKTDIMSITHINQIKDKFLQISKQAEDVFDTATVEDILAVEMSFDEHGNVSILKANKITPEQFIQEAFMD